MAAEMTADYPTPRAAYADAPSALSEIRWVARQVANRAFGEPMGREFWLRKAALLDRIALDREEDHDADASAVEAAARLADFDRAHFTTRGHHGPRWDAPEPSYRPYVRQEFRAWTDSLS